MNAPIDVLAVKWHPAIETNPGSMVRPWTVRRAAGHRWEYLMAKQSGKARIPVARRFESREAAQRVADIENAARARIGGAA